MNAIDVAYQLKLEDRHGYLYAEVTGDTDSLEITLSFWQAIAQACRQRNSRCLLVLDRLGQFQGERDMPGMVAAIIAMGFENIRIAYVNHSVGDRALHEHGAILAQEQGINGRVFVGVEDAELWLRHPD
mgnify:FL=1